MNRNDRTKLKNACTDFDRDVRKAVYIFNNEVELMKDEEDEKLERLPSQLQNSVKGDQLSESVTLLADVLEKIENLSTSLDDITDALGVQSAFIMPQQPMKQAVSPGRKGKSFHALFPVSLMKELKVESRRRGISMNELLCRTLQTELEGRE